MTLATIILMDLLTGTEFDLFIPSFPELEQHFNLTPFWVEALLSINFIGYCVSLFFVGSLADRYGRKPVLTHGLIIFIIGSVLCVWAPSYSVILFGRFLQGIGVASPAILSFLIIADSYPLQKQQFLMSMLNGVMNASVGAAPIIGSYITLYFHWQGNFIALLILGAITLFMTLFFIPHYKLPGHKETLSFRGYLPLFQSKPLLLLMAYLILMVLPYWIFVGISPILYMKDLGVKLSHFGYYQGSLALIFAIGSVFFGLVIHKYQQQKMLSVSEKISIISFIGLLVLTATNCNHPLLITLTFIPFIISQIIPSNLLFPLCLNFIPAAKGKISAMLQGSRLIFTALALQLAGYFYEGSFQATGIIISSFVFAMIIAQFFVLKNSELNIKLSEVKPDPAHAH